MNEKLTPRQIEIMRLLIEGKRQKETAAALGLTRSAVANHVDRICNKLGALTAMEAVAIYTRRYG